MFGEKLIGRDPLEIDRISKDLVGYLGFRSTGAEMRGNSALDIALWDVFGKVAGQPWRSFLAASRAQNPHLQYVRRHRLHAQGDRPNDVELWHGRRRARPLR